MGLYETRRVSRDGTGIEVDVTISPILNESGNPAGFSVIARDISSKVRAEEGLVKRILKYDISRGRIYLAEEPSPDLSRDVLYDLIKCGYSGIVITRKLPEELNMQEMDYLWISEKKGKNTLQPDISKVESAIINLPNWNNAVLLELDYIIFKNGFRRVFEFIHRIKETFYFLKKGVIILSVDPSILKQRDVKLLRKECGRIESKHHELPPEIYEAFRYIYMNSRVGKKTSIKDIMQKFEISRNTAKKRLRYLEGRGLLKVVKVGRLKLLEITDQGREIFY